LRARATRLSPLVQDRCVREDLLRNLNPLDGVELPAKFHTASVVRLEEQQRIGATVKE
jgi:hypothetical protein